MREVSYNHCENNHYNYICNVIIVKTIIVADIYSMSDSVILQETGLRIRQYRLDLNKTQKSLAEEAGVSLSTIAKIESGGSVAFHSIVAVLRAINKLELIEPIIKEPEISPILYAKILDGQKVRLRAYAAKEKPKDEDSIW